MAYARVVINSEKANLIYSSISPDIKSDKDHKILFKKSKNNLILEVKTKKLNHLKSIISSYISIVNLLEGL